MVIDQMKIWFHFDFDCA